jgi:acetyl esterase/lipase
MKMLARFLGLLSGAISAVVLRPVNTYQGFLVKSTATAQTPTLALLGALATALGIKHRSLVATISGAFSTVIGVSYIRRVTAPHDGFPRAFGSDWQRRLPPQSAQHMLARRLSWWLPKVPEPRWARDVAFWTIPDTDRQLLADLWEPPIGVEPSGTVVVYLYGGSWHFFDKDVLTRPFFRQLAAQGHVVMDVGHRSCPEVDVVGMVGDVHRAVAWIKANAAGYLVDPERIVLMGGSSGAHIALLAAYAPGHPQLTPAELHGVDTSVMAVVSYYGIPDMYSAYERWMAQEAAAPERPQPATERRELGKVADFFNQRLFGRTLTAAQSPPAPPVRQLLQNLLGGLPDDVPQMYDLASPIHHVNAASPPTLIFQGTHDAVVPLDAARHLYRALEAAGVTVVYVELPWTEHAFDLMYPPLANPAAKAALYDMERFLACVANEPSQHEAMPLWQQQESAAAAGIRRGKC